MIDGDGNVRITDFGIATAGRDADTTTAGTLTTRRAPICAVTS
jgi:hypothetical protein